MLGRDLDLDLSLADWKAAEAERVSARRGQRSLRALMSMSMGKATPPRWHRSHSAHFRMACSAWRMALLPATLRVTVTVASLRVSTARSLALLLERHPEVTTLHVEVSEPHSFRTLRLGPAAPLAPQHWEALGVLGPWLTHLSFTGGAGAPYETNPVWPESVEQHAAAAAATRETRMGALAGLELPRLTRLTLVTGMSPLASLAFTAAPGQLPALTHLNIDVGNVMGLGLVIESLDLASRAALQELELKGAIALRPSEAGGTSCAALRLPPSCVARLRIDWGMMNRVPVKCTLENVCGSFPAPAGSLFDTEAAKEALECAVRGCAKEVFSLVFEYLFDTCDDQKRENRCPGDLMEECGFADSAYHDVFEGYEFSNYPQTMDGFLDWVDALLEDAKVPPFDCAWVKHAFARPRHER